MSITIVTYPTSGSTPTTPLAMQLPQIVTVNESDATGVKMRLQFLEISNSITATLYAYGDPDNAQNFTFDISDIIEDSLSFDLQDVAAAGQLTTSNSERIVWLSFQSYYEDADGVLQPLNAKTFSSELLWSLNANRQYLDTQSLLDYFILPNSVLFPDRQFLTNYPSTYDSSTIYKKVRLSDSEFLSAYTNYNDAIMRIVKTDYDGTETILDSTLDISANYDNRFDFGIGPANLNALSGGFIDSNTNTYRVNIIDNTASRVSEVRYYKLQRDCLIDPVRVHFLNWLGAFESFTFEGISKEQLKTSGSRYEKYLGSFGSLSTGQRGYTTLKIEGVTRVTAKSYPLTEYELTWLKELLTSQVVFIEENDRYIPVTQGIESYTIDDKTDNLQRLYVTFDYANKLVTGRG